MAIFVTTIAVVAGWIAVEIWVFNRLRIGVYDTEYVSPPVRGGPAVTGSRAARPTPEPSQRLLACPSP